jgi:hypothetical protein
MPIGTRNGVEAALNRSPAALAAAMLVIALTGCSSPRATYRAGQWIWSVADRRLFLESHLHSSSLTPGVWLSTIRFDDRTGRIEQRLALDPADAGGIPLAAVVRFDRSFHLVWARLDDAAVARLVGERLDSLLAQVTRSGAPIAEVQLDYDCPIRRLPRWARVVGLLGRTSLAGREVWITSLVAHLREPSYGRLFRGVIAGHIVQVFDTGDRDTPSSATDLERLLARQRLPFRLGVGAFERRLGSGELTDHRAWFFATRTLSRLRNYRGLWVFPAGQPWTLLAEASP